MSEDIASVIAAARVAAKSINVTDMRMRIEESMGVDTTGMKRPEMVEILVAEAINQGWVESDGAGAL